MLPFVLIVSLLAGGVFSREAAGQEQDARTQGREQDRGKVYELQEGDTFRVPESGLSLQIEQVQDQTSEGCLGGPVGCMDRARMKVISGKDSKEITLSIVHTEEQRKRGVDRAICNGYRISLESVKQKTVRLRIEAIPPAGDPKF